MTCAKFCGSCLAKILMIDEQYFHQISIMLEKLLVKWAQANCHARSALNIYLHVKQTSEGVMFVSFILQLFTWLMQHKSSISYFPWKLFCDPFHKWLFTPQPSGLEGYCRHGPGGRAGGRAGGCQTCGTHISVTAWWIFSVRSSMELSRPVVVHCHAHLPICPICACPWAKNLSNLPQIGSRLCGSHISETAGWIYPI